MFDWLPEPEPPPTRRPRPESKPERPSRRKPIPQTDHDFMQQRKSTPQTAAAGGTQPVTSKRYQYKEVSEIGGLLGSDKHVSLPKASRKRSVAAPQPPLVTKDIFAWQVAAFSSCLLIWPGFGSR